MANLKEIRNRISSVSSTMQITSAMKMVSAAKLKKAQDSITAMRPYSDKLTELLQGLSASLPEGRESVYSEQRDVKNVLLVVISSNRGLCGAFNSNIIKEVNKLTDTIYKGKNVELLTIGKRADDILSKSLNVVSSHNDIYDDLTFSNVEKVALSVMNSFVDGKYDKVELIYNKFKNAASQIVTKEQFLPILPLEVEEGASLDYIFEPNQEEIVETLIPKSLKIQFLKGIRDSYASEHGARMTAMHMATDNANELRNQLKLTYNKARQAAITNEILEIVGGAEALNN